MFSDIKDVVIVLEDILFKLLIPAVWTKFSDLNKLQKKIIFFRNHTCDPYLGL